MTAKVFVSMGTPYTDTQRAFKAKFMQFVQDLDLNPRAIDENEYPEAGEDSLKHILRVMNNCTGVIVVAYERKHVQSGAERRQSDKEKPISNSNYTTPWNHIEAAFAYSLRKPLFMVCETGLTMEGLLDKKMLQWSVMEVPIEPASLSDQTLKRRLESWGKSLPDSVQQRPGGTLDLTEALKMPILDIVRSLSVKSWGLLISVGGTIFAAGVFVGTNIIGALTK